MKDISDLIRAYEEGVITHYELFVRARERGWGLQFEEPLLSEFKEWSESHPEDSCVSFTIFA